MKKRHKKFILIVTSVIGVSVAGLFILDALEDSVAFFYSPAEVKEGKAPANRVFRLGGMVKKGSVKKSGDSLKVWFVVTDFKNDISVQYEGILPDLFREGQSVVTQGRLIDSENFKASEVLAKHDEKYIPKEVEEALKRAGRESKK